MQEMSEASLQEIERLKLRIRRIEEEIGLGYRYPLAKSTGKKVEGITEIYIRDIDFLKKRVQHLEEEMAKAK